MKGQKLRSGEKVHAEVERPLGFIVGLAAFGTLVYFVEVFSYLFLVFTGLIFALRDFPFLFQSPFIFYMRILGLIFTSIGYSFLFGVWLFGVDMVFRGRCLRTKGLSLRVHTVMFGIPLI